MCWLTMDANPAANAANNVTGTAAVIIATQAVTASYPVDNLEY